MISDRAIRDSASESQNFTLRISLSEDSIIEDTQDLIADNKKKDKDDVIVISDSSCSSSHEDFDKRDWRLASTSKNETRYQKLHVSETSFLGNEREKLDSQWRKLVRSDNKSSDRKCVNKNTTQVSNAFYTSDETIITSSSYTSYDRGNDQMEKSNVKKSYGSPRITFEKLNTKERNADVNKVHEMYNIKRMHGVITPNRVTSSDSSSVVGKFNKFSVRNTPQQDSAGKIKLTKADTHKILKNIKSTQIVYNSPREEKKTNVIISESTDEDENVMHPAISPRNNREIDYRNVSPDVIETSLNYDIVSDSRTISSMPRRKYTDKFLETSRQEEFHRPLSEKKKKQIAEWLLANQSDSRSDSSCSNIPTSVRKSVGSGNSSLERLEQVYETPNNRGKINKMRTDEKQSTNTNHDGAIQSSSARQTTLDNVFKRSKDNSLFHMPNTSQSLTKVHADNKVSSSSVTNESENINVKKCSDILDKLYGKSWRDKVDVLLPTSEPRVKCIQKTNRFIQTERKPKLKNKYHVTNPGNSVEHNVKANPERKVQRKYKRKVDSFINDKSLSSDDSESMYHTALTNPGAFKKNGHNNVPSEQKYRKPFLGVCDTDTEDELDDISSNNSKKSLRGKRLSFSDDESSETSEFDPGDYVPPKHISRREITKTPRPFKVIPETTNRTMGHKSFLASLSDKVPITNAHPNAKRYRMDYKNKKEELCKELFKLYNEKVFDNKLPLNMPIEWNVRMRGTAGFCYNKKSVKSLTGIVRSSRIVLATKILDAPDRLRDTLIHEMCHAASWLINNVLDGHGPYWTTWANKAMKAFPELPPIRRCHDYEIKTKFTYKCTGCGYSIGRHSKSLNIEQKRCGHCYGKFELLVNKTTKSGTVQMQTPKKEPSGFALYVKQNYSSVKKEKSNIKHAEVMKILGIQT